MEKKSYPIRKKKLFITIVENGAVLFSSEMEVAPDEVGGIIRAVSATLDEHCEDDT